MKVLFEFSRAEFSTFTRYYHTIREEILKSNTLSNDLLEQTLKKGHENVPDDVFKKVKYGISRADGIIIEGSVVGLSLGYVLTEGLRLGKPVLFIVHSKYNNRKNRFVASIKSKLLFHDTYDSIGELSEIVTAFLDTSPLIKTRFNLVMNNKLDSYIIQQSDALGISKTEYILNLIKKDKSEKSKRK